MATVEMQDVSPGGHVLGHATVEGLPSRATLRDVLVARIDAEVAAYNADPGPIYRGLVQPQDSVRYSDGFRMRTPRLLDAATFVTASEEAIAAGVVVFRVGTEVIAELSHEVEVDAVDLITAELRRPIVARAPRP